MSEIPDPGAQGEQEREDLLQDLASALAAEPGQDDGAFGDLERLASGGQQGLSVSADGLLARVPRLDERATYEAVIVLMERHNIRYGIDFESIREALDKASRGQVQYGVIVAQGEMPREIARARVEYRGSFAAGTDAFAALCAVLGASDIKALERFAGQVYAVRPGQTLAEWIPPRFEPGRASGGRCCPR